MVRRFMISTWATTCCTELGTAAGQPNAYGGAERPFDPLPPGRLLSPNGLLGASAEEIQIDHRKPLFIERFGADHADTATGRIQEQGHESRLESLDAPAQCRRVRHAHLLSHCRRLGQPERAGELA